METQPEPIKTLMIIAIAVAAAFAVLVAILAKPKPKEKLTMANYRVFDNLGGTVAYSGTNRQSALDACAFTSEPPEEDYQFQRTDSVNPYVFWIWQENGMKTQLRGGTKTSHADVTAAKQAIINRDEEIP